MLIDHRILWNGNTVRMAGSDIHLFKDVPTQSIIATAMLNKIELLYYVAFLYISLQLILTFLEKKWVVLLYAESGIA